MARLKQNFDFLAGVYLDNELFFNRFNLMVEFYANNFDAQDQNIAVDRMNSFIMDMVQRSVFICEDDHEAIVKYSAAKIPVLTVPAPGPVDPIIQAVLVTKINLIMEDVLTIDRAEMDSIVGGKIGYIWDYNDDTDGIHDIVNDEDDRFWWATATPRVATVPVDSDINDFETIQWSDLKLAWPSENNELDVVFTPEEPNSNNKIINFKDYDKR